MQSTTTGCPTCGSDRLTRTGGVLMPDAGYDEQHSGTFECGHCGATHQHLQARDTLPEYSPTAQCTHCGSYHTKVIKKLALVHRAKRYHVCETCRQGFQTISPAGA